MFDVDEEDQHRPETHIEETNHLGRNRLRTQQQCSIQNRTLTKYIHSASPEAKHSELGRIVGSVGFSGHFNVQGTLVFVLFSETPPTIGATPPQNP
jgi:hypothetical protein